MMNQKIVPHLWFDDQAIDAAEFYTNIFPDSEITSLSTVNDTPSGDSSIVSFDLAGFSFMAIMVGRILNLTPPFRLWLILILLKMLMLKKKI